MALSPQSNEAFLREVDEELRRDSAIALWRRWGIAAIGAIVLGLIALAGWLWWQSHRQTAAGDQGIEYNKALEDLSANRNAAAAPTLAKLSKDGTPGYAALAKFMDADIALQKNDLKSAAAKFAEVANDTNTAQPLRDLALIRQTYAEYDTLKPQVIIDRMRPLAIKGKPYFGSAGEMTAIAYLATGRKDLAGRMFGDLANDETVPTTIRQRSVQQAGVLGVDAVDQSKDKTAG